MTPSAVIVHTSQSPYFPHIDQYYDFAEFERLAVTAAMATQDKVRNVDGEYDDPVTHCTVYLDNGCQLECWLYLARHRAHSLEDYCREVLQQVPDAPILSEIQWVTH